MAAAEPVSTSATLTHIVSFNYAPNPPLPAAMETTEETAACFIMRDSGDIYGSAFTR
jgi:hypothetical protein